MVCNFSWEFWKVTQPSKMAHLPGHSTYQTSLCGSSASPVAAFFPPLPLRKDKQAFVCSKPQANSLFPAHFCHFNTNCQQCLPVLGSLGFATGSKRISWILKVFSESLDVSWAISLTCSWSGFFYESRLVPKEFPEFWEYFQNHLTYPERSLWHVLEMASFTFFLWST